MKPLFFSFVLLFASNHICASLDLQTALKNKQVKLSLISNGNGIDEGMLTAQIQNVAMHQLQVKIPVGTQLISSEEDRQDLILVQEEFFALAPNEKKSILLIGMCMQASNRSPGEGAAYSVGGIMPGHLAKCAGFINDNKIFNSTGQEAIWAFSDNHDVAWINASNEKESALRKLVAELKGVPDPWFTNKHSAGNNQLARGYNPSNPRSEYYNMTAAEIKGRFKWQQNKKAKLSLYIINEEGVEVRKYFENREFNKGDIELGFHYKTSHIKRGKYQVVLKDGSQIVAEESFTF